MKATHVRIRGKQLTIPMRRLLVVLMLMCIPIGRGDELRGGATRTERDEAYQSLITQYSNSSNLGASEAAFERLMSINGGDSRRLVAQLVWRLAKERQDEGVSALAGRVFKQWDNARIGIVGALLPLLDDVDAEIRRAAGSLLRGLEDRSALRPPDYSSYHSFLEADFRAGREPQASLIMHMFESDPGVALLTLMRASQMRNPVEMKPILWAEHVVADLMWRRQFGFVEAKAVDPAVVRELDKLSQHTAWWARLYVAEIIRKNPELGTKSIRDRLVADSHELVRKSATPHAPSK